MRNVGMVAVQILHWKDLEGIREMINGVKILDVIQTSVDEDPTVLIFVYTSEETFNLMITNLELRYVVKQAFSKI